MDRIRAYIIDSHVLIRQTLVNIIRRSNGSSFFGSSIGISFEEILQDINSKQPDLIFLGIDEMDSEEMELFNFLTKTDPSLPIVVITPCHEKGAMAAIHCLKNGAVDFISKPVRSGRLVFAKEHFAKRVNPLLQIAERLNLHSTGEVEASHNDFRRNKSHSKSTYIDRLSSLVDLVVIGGCTGGVRSLFSLVSSFPKKLNVPIIILQHMPKIYSKILAKELNKLTAYKVSEAKSGVMLKPGHIHVVPGSYHAVVRNDAGKKTISLHRGPREEGARPSLNVLLRSASHIYRDKMLGVFLSGGGDDGVIGAREVADKGGQIITESESSSLLWDLPKQLEDQGIATESFPAEMLAREIYKRSNKTALGKSLKRFKQTGNFAVTG